MTRNDKLLEDLRKVIGPELYREIVQLRKRMKVLESQRDDWKEKALRYRKQYLEEKENVKWLRNSKAE